MSIATKELNCGIQAIEEEKEQDLPTPIRRTSDQQSESISDGYIPAPLLERELQAVSLPNETDLSREEEDKLDIDQSGS